MLAVDHIDLNVHAGDVYGFLGPNGAGKTTTLRMALGPDHAHRGHASSCSGATRMRDGARALEGVAGFVEAPRFYPYLTARKNLELLAALDGDGAAARIDEVLDDRRAERRAPSTRSAATRTACASAWASPRRCCAARGC